MRDDELRAFLRQVNPWWRAAVSGSDPTAWTAEDRSLRGRAEYDLGYRSPVLSDVATQPLGDGLYVLRGPRRVGKSVVLKDLVAALCARPDVDPREVVYLPVDTFGARDLRRSVALGLDLTRAASGARRVWLFDEITGVDGWTAEIKSLRDNTAFGESTVVLTGSSSAGAERAVRDLGAGRAGRATGSPFRTLLPMTFRSVLAATGVDVPLPSAVEPWRLQSPEAADRLESLALFVDDLDLAWQRYLETGGFPRAVGEHQRTGEVSTAFVADLAAWLTADVDPSAPPDSVSLLVAELQVRAAAPLNVRNLAAGLGLTREQLTARLNRLVSTYAAIRCPQVDDAGRRVVGAQAKLYLTDPLLGWLGHVLRPGLAAPDFTRLTESTLAVTLARVLDQRSPGRWTSGDTIGYARTEAGNEVDLAPVPVATAGGDRATTPVESKWVSGGWRPEARVVEGRYAAGVLATKDVLDTSHDTWAVPAPMVSLLLE